MLADMVPISAEVSYIEIGVSDASKSRAFLEQMFGWKFHPFGQGAEGWFQTPSLKAGIHGGDPNWGFLLYFGVPDLEVAIADVNRLGERQRSQLTNQGLAGSVSAVIRRGCASDFISDSQRPVGSVYLPRCGSFTSYSDTAIWKAVTCPSRLSDRPPGSVLKSRRGSLLGKR